MKSLYIVRHAKSSWDYPHLSDDQRPLNKRGKRDAPKMSQYIAEGIEKPDIFISSPAVRAFKTAESFASAFDLDSNKIHKDRNLYHASSFAWSQVIAGIEDQYSSAMLFGHNPGLTDFVNRICGSDIYNIPTCGVAGIKLPVDSWSDIEETQGALDFYYYPKGI